jgi:hypothetical protein
LQRARRKETRRAFKKLKRERPRPSNSQTPVALKKPPPPIGLQADQPKPVDQGTGPVPEQTLAPSSKDPKVNPEGEKEGGQRESSGSPAQLKEPTPKKNDGLACDNDSNGNNLQTDGKEAVEAEPEKSFTDATKSLNGLAEASETKKPPQPTDGYSEGVASGRTSPSAPKTESQQASSSTLAAPQKPEIYLRGSNSNERILNVKALREDGSIDIFAYHRGREGMEPRDEVTGELLCDVEPTDTNFNWDEPKLCAQITVSFPLCDEVDTERSSDDIPLFEDTITWDLGDPETPTPMDFAADVAENYGLSCGQTIDLAFRIQEQLNLFVKENCGYAVPLALTDGAGNEREHFATPFVTHLYGQVFPGYTSGKFMAPATPASKSKSRSSNRMTPSLLSQGSSSRRGTPFSEGGSRSTSSRPPPVNLEEAVDEKFILEVQKRMVDCSKADVLAKARIDVDPLGFVELKTNHICHICHKRNNLVGQFPCGFSSHSYCGMHLRVSSPFRPPFWWARILW